MYVPPEPMNLSLPRVVNKRAYTEDLSEQWINGDKRRFMCIPRFWGCAKQILPGRLFRPHNEKMDWERGMCMSTRPHIIIITTQACINCLMACSYFQTR